MQSWKGRRGPYVACVVLQTLIFGLGNVVTKFAYESVTPLWCQVFRFGLAAAVFAVLFGPRIVRQLRGVKLRAWVPAAACMAFGYVMCNVALDLTTATNVGFLVALPVVFTPFISLVVQRRGYPRAMVPFQVAVVGGLYLLCCNGGSFSFGLGEVLALLSSAAIAGALVFGEEGLADLDAMVISGTQITVTFFLALACALIFEPPVNVAAVRPEAWAVIAFLALLSTCLTFALQNVALVGLPSSTVSLFLTAEPVFTALFSLLLLGEQLSLVGWAGACVIFASVVGATMVEGRANADAGANAESRSASRSAEAPAPMRHEG